MELLISVFSRQKRTFNSKIRRALAYTHTMGVPIPSDTYPTAANCTAIFASGLTPEHIFVQIDKVFPSVEAILGGMPFPPWATSFIVHQHTPVPCRWVQTHGVWDFSIQWSTGVSCFPFITITYNANVPPKRIFEHLGGPNECGLTGYDNDYTTGSPTQWGFGGNITIATSPAEIATADLLNIPDGFGRQFAASADESKGPIINLATKRYDISLLVRKEIEQLSP